MGKSETYINAVNPSYICALFIYLNNMKDFWSTPKILSIGKGDSSPYFKILVLISCVFPIIAWWCYEVVFILALVVSCNTSIRLLFPSSYVPLSQAKKTWLANPFLARGLATVAELAMIYEQVCFFGECSIWLPLFVLIAVAEIFSWISVILRSEIFAVLEDFFWTIAQISALFTFYLHFLVWIITPYILYMIFYHHPRMLKRIRRPLFEGFAKPDIMPNDADTLSWQIPSLLLLPIIYTFFIVAQNI